MNKRVVTAPLLLPGRKTDLWHQHLKGFLVLPSRSGSAEAVSTATQERSKEGNHCPFLKYQPCGNTSPPFPAGSPITPNYIDNSTSSIAPWCTCNASGNRQDECESFLHLFTDNICLRKYHPAHCSSSSITCKLMRLLGHVGMNISWSSKVYRCPAPCAFDTGALKTLGYALG